MAGILAEIAIGRLFENRHHVGRDDFVLNLSLGTESNRLNFMDFRIPQAARKSLAEFIALSEDSVSRLIDAIRKAPPALHMEEFAGTVASASKIDYQKVEEILSMFAGMHLARTAEGRNLNDFVSDLSEAIRKLSDNKLVPRDWDSFQRNVKAILASEDSLGVSAKALDLLIDNEHGLHSVRIITDVRHVFAADPTERPKACVIVHMLNLVYHEIDGMKELYIAIDDSDLEDLKLAVDRAKSKARNLETIAKEIGINCLSAQE